MRVVLYGLEGPITVKDNAFAGAMPPWTQLKDDEIAAALDYVLTAWGRFYGATAPLDRRVAPSATPVTVMTDLDFPRVFALYKELLTRKD